VLNKSIEPIITFFIPCFNEEFNIANTLNTVKFAAAGIIYEIIVVDDGSTDSTTTVIENFMKNNEDVRITFIKNKSNMGLGANFINCSRFAKAPNYCLINGDNVEPEEQIKTLVENIGKADLIIPYYGNLDRRGWSRKSISSLYSFLINFISGNRIIYYNGAVIHPTSFIQSWQSKVYGYGYQSEIICAEIKSGMNFIELKTQNSDRQWGFSKAFSIKNILSVLFSLIKILVRRFN
jgi:glycosyltransferase involved in cell wall biosynthesis